MSQAKPPEFPAPEVSRGELAGEFAALPLPQVPYRSTGLLRELPAPPAGRVGWPWTVETLPEKIESPPRITVVTPSFQHGRYLEETIRSVLLQNYPNLEYVVIDGGSSDETKSILEKYRPWLSFSRSAPDRGQGHAINLGFSLAAGDLRGWLNSDDFYLPGALSALAHAARRSNAEFFYGDGLTVDDVNGRASYSIAPRVSSRYLHFGGLIFSHAAFWRTPVHQPIWEAMRCNVDGELWLRLIPDRKLNYLPRPLGAVRIQSEAKTVHPRHRAAWAEDDAHIWAIHGTPPPPRAWIRYEYRYAQRVSNWWRRHAGAARRRQVLNACGWSKTIELLP